MASDTARLLDALNLRLTMVLDAAVNLGCANTPLAWRNYAYVLYLDREIKRLGRG